MKRTATATAITLALMMTVGSDLARAQADFPSRPLKLILPQPAGGAVDLIARTLADRLSDQMKQPVIVENMPGANGGLAASAVVRSAADGYTLFMAVDTNLVVNPSLYPNLSYQPFRDFTPISILSRLYLMLVASNKSGAKSVSELIALAKAQPGKLNYASIGLGTQAHLGMELFKLMTKTNIAKVDYRGTAPAMTAVVAGEVETMFTGPPSAKAMSDGGQLRVLGTASPTRAKLLPDVPTVAEAGVPGYELGGWFGLLAPARTPKPIVDRIAAEVRTAVTDARFSERLVAQGMEIVGSSPEEMHAMMQADTKKWAEVIDATGAKIQQ